MNIGSLFAVGADAASILSLVGTIAVWHQTNAIREAIGSRTRIPEARNELRRHAEQLLPLLKDIPALHKDLHSILAKVEPILDNVEKKLKGDDKKKIQSTKVLLADGIAKRHNGQVHTKEYADLMWSIYWGLLTAISVLDQFVKDFNQRT